MAYVSVSIAHQNDWRNYKAAGFSFSFRASSSGVWNGDGQVVEVWNGGQLMHRREFSGNLWNNNYDSAADASTGSFAAQGERHTFTATIKTYDKRGDGNFYAEASATGYSLYTPRIALSMFAVTGTGASTSSVECTNMDTPQSERLSYQNWKQDGYRQVAAGTKNTTVTYTDLEKNTRKQLAFGMIRSNEDNGYLGNGEECRVLPWVFPAYSSPTKGSLSAVRNTTTPSTIAVSWGAWAPSTFGNMSGWKAEIQILNGATDAVIKTQACDVYSAGSTNVTGVPLDVSIKVRLRVYGPYHDGTTKTEYSTATIDLGYLNNTFYKVGGVWRRGIRTYYKVGGTWRANNGLVRHKTGERGSNASV